ncbi:melanoma-associated antigen B5-like [Saccopteryx bilineata]|uniref:melanoma-associated antigen B5-like n=1 Tax=Saccopteryx bilineata TaxID=59482 RepID=UPI0033907669
MPRGHKSKFQARQKRHQAQGERQGCSNDQATAGAKEESTPSSSPQCEDITQSQPAAGSRSTSRGPPRTKTTSTASAGVSCSAPKEASNSQDEGSVVSFDVPVFESCEVPLFTLSSEISAVTEMAVNLEIYLMYKYRKKQPILKEDMLKIIGEEYKNQFAKILKRASEKIETTFAIDLREDDPTLHSYVFVSKLKLPNNGRVFGGRGLPKTSLLLNVLGLITFRGNCISEEELWRQLSLMRVYPGRKHGIFGEPRKLITKDFVRLKYLEYRQVPGSDPPCFELLWGPKAHLETSKMKVLEFWAKGNNTHPSAFPCCYEEALRDEEERNRAGNAARAALANEVESTSQLLAALSLILLRKSQVFSPSHQNI